MNVNPRALAFVGICTLVGYLLGSWPLGLLVGLVVVVLA